MAGFRQWLSEQTKTIPPLSIKTNVRNDAQDTNYSCGAAVLSNICQYFNVGPKDEADFIKIVASDPEEGTTPQNIVRGARACGLHAEIQENMSLAALLKYLDRKIPVICNIQAWGNKNEKYSKAESGHYVVAIGYDHKHIYFQDPSVHHKRGFLTPQEFLQRWHDEDQGHHYVRLGIPVWKTGPVETKPLRREKAKKIE